MASQDPISQIERKRVYIETYGCTYNAGDSEKIAVILRGQGCEIVRSSDEADTIVLNTCIVVEKTEREMRQRLSHLGGREVYVTGCLPKIDPGCGGVVIDPDTIHHHFQSAGTQPDGRVAVIQIARGCTGHCTYCITKKARGPLLSYPVEEVVRQLKGRVARGAVEIQLTAQDVSAWGMDLGSDLGDLISALSAVPGTFAIRMGMMNPDTLNPVLGKVLRACRDDRIFSFFHIPIQSGSDTVLRRMGRRYTRDDVIRIVEMIREEFPYARISTDIICGFPGETGEEFSETINLLRAIRPEKINITRYSARPGTPAASWYDMPDRFKKDRSRQATAVARGIFDEIYTSFIGEEMDVVVTEVVKEGTVTTRDRAYRPIIISEPLEIGSAQRVRITGHRHHYLLGDLIR
ncbi:MiaB-like tRNA modifying enzyme [Methanocalculus alkaliphilus]|uniref:tRNA (N(6)-L-threonylcarbamoyladenosine(37)-C(2))- methylthiotransferase n=1 Tax=Methanocalculus alkaliphilus TaxID=768730 RepID=UPI0020A0CA77|nr:tRNA (N(6)-L-threonylcarbamoyladenosine(37)-C(2))-methylthiotransferase [Methanocalculus alkaliphilus]MCP1714325.1 MiaB-like tRNA modifying enzyme [Methanocalculus alkaliphilus]